MRKDASKWDFFSVRILTTVSTCGQAPVTAKPPFDTSLVRYKHIVTVTYSCDIAEGHVCSMFVTEETIAKIGEAHCSTKQDWQAMMKSRMRGQPTAHSK